MSFRVFLSHSVSPAELGIVYAIAEESARRGMQPYIPDRDWDPEQQLPERISAALREADVCVAVATQFGAQLPWVNSEIAGAVARPVPLIAILDSALPPQNALVEGARVTITQEDLPGTLAQALHKIEETRLQQTQRAALTWLVIGGLLFLSMREDG